MTIPKRLRLKFGLLPHTVVTFEEGDGCVVIRPALRKRELVAALLREARGVVDTGATTDDVMRLTRGEN